MHECIYIPNEQKEKVPETTRGRNLEKNWREPLLLWVTPDRVITAPSPRTVCYMVRKYSGVAHRSLQS